MVELRLTKYGRIYVLYLDGSLLAVLSIRGASLFEEVSFHTCYDLTIFMIIEFSGGQVYSVKSEAWNYCHQIATKSSFKAVLIPQRIPPTMSCRLVSTTLYLFHDRKEQPVLELTA